MRENKLETVITVGIQKDIQIENVKSKKIKKDIIKYTMKYIIVDMIQTVNTPKLVVKRKLSKEEQKQFDSIDSIDHSQLQQFQNLELISYPSFGAKDIQNSPSFITQKE